MNQGLHCQGITRENRLVDGVFVGQIEEVGPQRILTGCDMDAGVWGFDIGVTWWREPVEPTVKSTVSVTFPLAAVD